MADKSLKAMSKTSRLIFSFYIILALIMPAAAAAVNLMIRDAYIWSHNWNTAVKIIMLFVTLPIYMIYTFLVLKRLFPGKTMKALLLFFPYILSITIYSFQDDLGLTDFLILNSLPFFLGINLLYFAGLIMLIIKKSRQEPLNEVIKKIAGTIAITGLMFFPVVHTFLSGIRLNMEKGGWIMLLGFIFIIISTGVSHFPFLKQLYKEGRL